MDIVTVIILGALGNALYDAVKSGIKQSVRPSNLYGVFSNLRWKRLYEQAGVGDLVERYRAAGSQEALLEIGKAVEKALQSEEFASLASDVHTILASQEGLRDIMEAGFSQLITGQDQMKDIIRRIPRGPVTIQIGQPITIQIKHDTLACVLTDTARGLPLILPPVDVSHFTGRQRELSALVTLLRERASQAVVGFWGAPGVGKSALACYFAKKNTEWFPDGVICADSRNKEAGRLAADFAALIGEPVDPGSQLDPSAIIQSRFAKRRVLLILDNANRADIRKLVPGGLCTVFVTTRDLDILHHMGVPPDAQIYLHHFGEDEALTFLARLVGEEAVLDEEDSARELARLVGGLPLALRVAGASLRSQFLVSSPFAHYVTNLRDEKSRLSQLQWRDADELNVLAVFRLSLPILNSDEHKAFACMAACAESGFGRAAAAATAGLDEHTAEIHLSRFVNLALINFSTESGRCRFHPLLYLFAREEAEQANLYSEAQERHSAFFTAYVCQRQTMSRQNLIDLQIEQDAVLQTAHWKIERGDLDVSFWLGLRRLLECQGNWHAAEIPQLSF